MYGLRYICCGEVKGGGGVGASRLNDCSLTILTVLKYIAVIHRTKKHLPFSVLQTMYKSLILPIIYYGLFLWGPHCERLFLLQKRIMRVITNSKYIAHTDPIFKTLNLLKLPDLYRLQLYNYTVP